MRLLLGPTSSQNPRNDLQYFDRDVLTPFFKPGPVLPGGARLYERSRPFSNAPSLILPKPRDNFRVFVAGGSVGLPYGFNGPAADSLARQLRPYLKRGKHPEIIGCAMAGYDSSREKLVVKEIVRYDPDLIILMTGNNESGRPAPSMIAWRLRRLSDLLIGHSRLLCEARRIMGSWLFAAFPSWPRPLGKRAALLRFESDVREMAALCRNANVPLLLCALPANLRDWPPQRIIPRRWLDDPIFMRGWIGHQESRERSAAKDLALSSRSSPKDPVPRFYLARSLEAARDFVRAKKEYESALNESFPSWAATPDINARLRRIAREKSLPLADVDAAISNASAHGIPGYDIFLDHCHWRGEYYPLVNASMIQAWKNRGQGEKLSRSFAARLSAARRLAAAPLHDPTRVLLEPLYESPSEKSCLVDERLVNALETVVRQNDASLQGLLSASGYAVFLSKKMPRFAVAPQPPKPPPWTCFIMNVAESQRRAGHESQAIKMFREVLKQRPLNPTARLGLAVSWAQAGRLAESKLLFDELRRRYPGRKEIAEWRRYFFAD